MADNLIDVDARMFDPDRLPDALLDAYRAIYGEDPDENTGPVLAGAVGFLETLFPQPPGDVAEYLDAVSKYLAVVVVSQAMTQAKADFLLPNQIAALEARVTALEE